MSLPRLRAGISGALALALLISLWSPSLRDASGYPVGLAVVPLTAALGLLLFGGAALAGAAVAGAWAGLSVAGFGACLQLIDAGTMVRYQHLRPPAVILSTTPSWVLALLAVQCAAVLIGLVRHRRQIAEHFGAVARPWQLALLLAVLFCLSATVSRQVGAWVVELFVATAFQLMALGNLLLAMLALPTDAAGRIGAWWDRLLGPPGDPAVPADGGLDRFALVAAGAVTLTTAALAVVVYQRHPHLLDEVVYLIQARTFAAGRLALPVPPVLEAFNLSLLDVARPGWYAVTQPGWSLMLVAGAPLGLAWLVNPILAGLSVLALYLLLRHLYDLRTTRLATLLYCCSPWQLFLGMSFMNHTATLLFALLAALGVVWTRRTGQVRWAWLGGAALGGVSLLRQLDAMAIAIPLGLWSLGLGGKRIPRLGTAGLVLGSMLLGAAVLPYNQQISGSARRVPMMEFTDSVYGKNTNAYGFGPDRGMGWPTDPFPGHGHRDAIVNADLNATAINVELFGWSLGSFAPLLLLLAVGGLVRGDRLMLIVTGAVFTAYYFNYFSGGPDFGGRYWYLMIVPLVSLTARGLEQVAQRMRGFPAEGIARHGRVLTGTTLLVIGCFAAFVPWRALDKYHNYRGMQPGLVHLATEHQFGRSLVLIRGRETPDFASAAPFNPLDLQAPVPIYAWDKGGAVRTRLAEVYSDRPVWVVDGPSRTGAGYRVVLGPLTSAELAVLPDNVAP